MVVEDVAADVAQVGVHNIVAQKAVAQDVVVEVAAVVGFVMEHVAIEHNVNENASVDGVVVFDVGVKGDAMLVAGLPKVEVDRAVVDVEVEDVVDGMQMPKGWMSQ